MCPFKLLVLLSTLPVEMAIAGQHEQEAEFNARKNSLASGQPVHAIANLMRTLGRKNSSFTALGTLAVTLVLGYLITRCFIAMASRTKGERGTVSRRLASGADYVCFEEEEARTRTEQPAWRKLLKPAIFVGAGAIVGVAMGAGITEGVMKVGLALDASVQMGLCVGVSSGRVSLGQIRPQQRQNRQPGMLMTYDYIGHPN